MSQCICGRGYKPSYSGTEDDLYCPKCREVINKVYNYTDKEYEHEGTSGRITEIGD